MRDSIRLIHVVNAGKVVRPFLEGQLRFIAARGIEVAVCAPAGAEVEEFLSRESGKFLSYSIHRTISVGNDVRSIAQLCRQFSKFRPHVVHAHGPKAGLVGMIAAYLTRIPIRICHVHGLPFLSDTQPQELLRGTTQITCALANQVLTVSPSMSRELVAAGCCPGTKVKTLCAGSINGMDAHDRFNPDNLLANTRQCVRGELAIPSEAFVLGFVGRIVRDKGISELLAAWDALRSIHPKLHMIVVGPFEQHDPIPATANAAILDDPRIHWVGETFDTPRLFAAMDLLVLPSYREGLPLVLLEAGAMRLPVIATDIPGCVDAVRHGVTGTLVPPRDAKALATAIASYILDPEMCRRHGDNGRAHVLRHFDQNAIWEATYAEYGRLLERHGITRPSNVAAIGSRAA